MGAEKIVLEKMFYENLGENGVWTRHHSINDTLVKLVDLLTFFPQKITRGGHMRRFSDPHDLSRWTLSRSEEKHVVTQISHLKTTYKSKVYGLLNAWHALAMKQEKG